LKSKKPEASAANQRLAIKRSTGGKSVLVYFAKFGIAQQLSSGLFWKREESAVAERR
jgi:hypothetical protein